MENIKEKEVEAISRVELYKYEAKGTLETASQIQFLWIQKDADMEESTYPACCCMRQNTISEHTDEML